LAFERFVALGPGRSLTLLASVLRTSREIYSFARAPSLRTLEVWSAKYGWQARLSAIEQKARSDFELRHAEAHSRLIEEMAERGRMLVEHGSEWFAKQDGRYVSAREAIKAVESGLRLQEFALTSPSNPAASMAEQKGESFNGTDEELESFIAIARELRARPQGGSRAATS
jgi:hypothetical protein